MKKFVCTIVLFAGLIQLNAQQSLKNKVDSLPFPRLCKLNWYSPSNFSSHYLADFGIDIGQDANNTALIGNLRIYDMIISSILGNKFQYLKDSLNPNMILFHNWNTTGISLQEIPNIIADTISSFPFQSKWFSSLFGSTLKTNASANDITIKVQPEDEGKFFFTTGTQKWNDNIFIEDIVNPERSEMILLDTVISNVLHIKASAHPPAYQYDFSKVKYNHLQGSKVWIVHCNVWDSWWGYNISSVCPKVKVGADSLKFNEYIARKIFQEFNQNTNTVDGIWLDTFNDYYFGPYCNFPKVIQNVDMDLNGIPDLNEGHDTSWVNRKWIEGRTEFAMHLRKLIGQNVPIVLNDGGIYSEQYVNGIHFEKLPILVWDTTIGYNPSQSVQWITALQQYTSQMLYCDFNSNCQTPRICQIQGTQSISYSMNYKKMRKSLTFTLMDNGFFYYTGEEYHEGLTFWWFDEYTVDSTGSAVTHIDGTPVNRVDSIYKDEALYQKLKKAKGYLGFPLGKYQNLGNGVLRRDFEHGVVFCNLSSNDVSVSISPTDTLKRIKGKQDTVVNNGAPVIGSFLLPRNDGIILLRKNKLTGIESENNLPTRFMLYQNYPNPFNPETVISYQIPSTNHVRLKIFDALGREVATLVNEVQSPREHHSKFSILPIGRQVHNYALSSGVYFYRLTAGNYTETKKMILLK